MSRSKRGIFIGQHAREELWTRFRNGEIKPIDAELVCKLTAALADQSQVAEIQAHCCGLLKAGKSWDYIGASVQLMASSQAQQAEQMLLDLGADFTADLERMARWVELCRKAFREAIDLLKDEKRRVKKGAKASRLGLSATMTEEKREEMLGDLEAMDAKFEMIGSYPELVAEAKMWDGDESKFADPVAMYLERVEAMQAEGLQEEQARRAAEEATGMFNWSSSLTGGSPAQNIDASMSGGYPKGSIIYINGREVDLSQCYAIDSSGNKLNKDDFITTPAGNINWYEFPSDEHTRQMMKKKGVKILPVRLRVGVQQKTSGAGGYGFMHVMKHYNQMVDMNPSESPLMHLFNTLTGKLSITKNGILRKTMDSANNGQARKLVIELKEDEGFYSIVSSYPVSYYPRESNGIAIKGVYLKFMPGRAASGLNESNQADSTTPESTGVTGQSLTGSIPKNAKSVNIYDLKILEKDGALVFQQKQEEKVNLASYSVTGGKNLAAVHSLNAEKFLAAVELGGMPMPSVAVTRLDRPYEWGGAGAINLIGKPEMVDPRKGADVYSADAYVMIVVAEEENGDKFYDLDATDVEDVETNKGVAETLEATRVPNAGRQGSSAPKGRIHRVKEYVNHIDAQNGNFSASVIGRNARTWGKYTDRAFVGRDDGMWRAEIDASGAKLKRAPLHRTDDSLVREVEKRLAFFREKLNERERWEPVSKLWAAGEYDGRTYGEMDFLMRTLRGAGLEFENMQQMAGLSVCSIVLDANGTSAAKRLLRVVELPGVEGFNRLGEVLDFPELYEAYPELKKVPVRWMDDNFRFRGIFSTEGVFKEAFIAVKRSRTDGGKLSTLLHEVQHWIQKHEGFAFGSPGGVKEHRVSAGEIEARNVQARRWMTADERAELPFNETLEYPGEALVTFSVQRKRDLTLDGERVTQKQAWEHLAALEGKPLRNARSQFVAVVNKPQRKELTNIGKALVSDLNGFSVETHYAAVGRIDKLFLHAVPCGVYKDKKHGDTQVVIHRFACPLMVDGEKAVAWLTAKETKNVPGNERLYNLELVDIEKLAGTLENLASHRLQDDLPSASRDIVAEVEDAFKTYFEDEPEAGNNFSASLTGAAAAGRRVLEESGDEYVANRLQEAWQKNLEKWSVLHAGKADANSAMRAVMEMEGLVKATYDVVQAQELDCEFLDDTSELLSYELIAGATSADASSVAAPEFLSSAPGSGRDIRLGIDFGRTNDPTVCWMFERVGDVCYTREVLVLKNCPTPAQEEILRSRIRVARRVCFDYTGPGIGMGDHLVQEFGQWNPGKHEFGKIELCTFTVAFKRDIFPKLRRAFEAPVRVRIPAGEDIREDLHSMQQLIKNGEYTYSAPHTAEGHSDRCTALALAWRAAADAVCTDMPIPVERGNAWDMPTPVSREIMNRPF